MIDTFFVKQGQRFASSSVYFFNCTAKVGHKGHGVHGGLDIGPHLVQGELSQSMLGFKLGNENVIVFEDVSKSLRQCLIHTP